MRPIDIHHSLVIFILVLVILILLVGTSQAFVSVKAATVAAPTAIDLQPADNGTTLTPTPLPTPVQVSADTTGIIALAMVIATTVLVGTLLGQRRFRKKKTS